MECLNCGRAHCVCGSHYGELNEHRALSTTPSNLIEGESEPAWPWGHDFEAWLEVRTGHEVRTEIRQLVKDAIAADRRARQGEGRAYQRKVDEKIIARRDTTIAELRAATKAAAPADAPADPLDMPLPCDVKVGAVTIRKGCKLRTLVTRMESLHRMLMNYMPKPTQAQKEAFEGLLADGAGSEKAQAGEDA